VINLKPLPLDLRSQEYLRKRQLSKESIDKWGFCQLVGYTFRDRVCFPIHDEYGEVVSYTGRLIGLTDEEIKARGLNKYWHISYEKGRHLYGFYQHKQSIFENNLAVVIEGQVDVIGTDQVGVDFTVGLSGKSVTNYQVALLSKYCDRVVVMLDSDASEKDVLAVVQAFESADFNVGVYSYGTTTQKVDPDLLRMTMEPSTLLKSIFDSLSQPVVPELRNLFNRLGCVQ
jgi:DNA primase